MPEYAKPVMYGKAIRKVENTFCVNDGVRRVAVPTWYTSEQDIPARITVFCRVTRKNKAVTGYLTQVDDDWIFIANLESKNGGVFATNREQG